MNFPDHREGVVVVHAGDGNGGFTQLGAATHRDGQGFVVVIGMEVLH
ncbi:MAG: hypothetical protein WCI65_10885 [Synechococcaceae cyanobacterium ELA263]